MMPDISTVVITLLEGLSSGMLLFLAAAGLTLTFGVLGVLNFAHGSFYMFGAYFAYFTVSGYVPNFWVAVLVATVGVALIGTVVERLLIRPIYDHDHIFQVLLTFAIVLVLDNAARIMWGTDFRSVEIPALLAFNVDILGRSYPAYNLFLIAVGSLVGVGIWFFFTKTHFGNVALAAAEDREMTGAVGVNVPLVFTGVFLVGSALAGLGGALATPYRSLTPVLGETIIIESFIVIIIGGLGSFRGAFVGALLITLTKSFAFLTVPTLEPLIPFILLVVVLLLKPNGLFGEVKVV